MTGLTDSKMSSSPGLDIAVIGMAGRFPGAWDVAEFWDKLLRGVEGVTFFSDAQMLAAGVAAEVLSDPTYVKAGGIVEGIELFDAGFFGFSPRDASLLDPQQRLFLELAWTALEHAGHAPGTFEGPVGVYAGVGWNDYLLRHVLRGTKSAIEHHVGVLNDKDFLATRVSYKLNLEGPSLSVQTACSTSLVAIHLASQALIAGECDMALAGGVTIRLPQNAGYAYQEEGISSPDGHCRAFSARAQGCRPGNGAGVVILRRLADALADGDEVHAVIKGSAVNNDGALKVGYTAPRVEGQAKVIRAALDVAGTPADTIGYLEAHGTGTALGDPIEIQAATRAFRADTSESRFCAVGAVKTNVGHLDAAAGVTGFIKAVLAVKHGLIPPTLHCDEPNPIIDFDSSPFFVNTALLRWAPAAGVRRAGVSSFGVGGTNAHVVLEQPPPQEQQRTARPREVLVLSARSGSALDRAMEALTGYLQEHPEANLSDVAFTLQQGRAALPYRGAVVVDAAVPIDRHLKWRTGHASEPPHLVFMFPGQGSQHAGMGRGLYDGEPEFRRTIDGIAEMLEPRLELDLRDLIRGTTAALDERLRDTRLAQPAIFAVSYALAQLFISRGVRPAAMIGHSIGEYVAACLSGVMSLEDCVTLVAERGALMSRVAPGGMAALSLPVDEVVRLLPAELEVAAVNAPANTVVAGPLEPLVAFVGTLAARGIVARLLHTSHAFHSSMMDPVLDAVGECAAAMRLAEPRIPFLSNVTGTWITAAQAMSPGYWSRHLREPVRFSEALTTALAMRGAVLLEVGPRQTLTALARRHVRPDGAPPVAVASMRRLEDLTTDDQAFLEALGALWTGGVPVDWRTEPRDHRRRVALPTYPFERHRHWIEPVPPAGAGIAPAEPGAAASRRPVAEWFSVPSWQRLPPEPRTDRVSIDSDPAWLVLMDDEGIGDELAGRLEIAGASVVRARAGETFARIAADSYTIDPASAADYRSLVAAVVGPGQETVRVLHCWTVGRNATRGGDLGRLSSAQALGFESLMLLTQALGSEPSLISCHVTVITSDVYDVTGDESLAPEMATMIGPCRVMGLEYAGFTAAHVDIVVPGDAAERTRTTGLLLSIVTRSYSGVLAIRGSHLWRQTFTPVRLDLPQDIAPLKPRGVYLITGGLGGLGLAIAGYLASRVKARLVLVGRSALPPREEWGRWLAPASSAVDPVLAQVSDAEQDIAGRVTLAPIGGLPGVEGNLEQLCAAYVLRFLQRRGVAIDRREWLELEPLAARCGVLPRFRRLFQRMLVVLADSGFAVAEGTGFRLTGNSAPDIPAIQTAIIRRFPGLSPVVALLDNCAGAYDAVLTGDGPALETLFGERYAETYRAAVAAIREHSYVPLCEGLVGELVSRLPERGPLRILEVGGGEGLLTRVLLPLLAGRDVEYHFTDISRSFVLSAEREAAQQGLDFMRFRTLDISRPPAAQEFETGAYDLVLAFNVLHATRNIEESLRHARELLRPGGLLVAQESVAPRPWIDFIWGLTDGWWAFEDSGIRATSPLIALDVWERVAEAAGYESVVSWPREAGRRAAADTGVIAARKPAVAGRLSSGVDADPLRERLAAIEALERQGAEVEVASADVADVVAMREVVARARRRFGTVDGVVHAALVLSDGTMQLKTREDAARVLAPKVAGTLALKNALSGLELDFFVLFSSLVSVVGGSGQVDYCAASNFQDAFAHANRSGLARTVLSINWPGWREIGMAFRTAVERGARPDEALADGISPAEGLDAFVRALASPHPQVLVTPNDLETVSRNRVAEVFGLNPARSSPVVSRGDASTPVVIGPCTETEQAIAEIWREVLGVRDLGVEDNIFDFGADSVSGLQFIAKARKAGLKFTNRQIFEHQTAAALAAIVDSRAQQT